MLTVHKRDGTTIVNEEIAQSPNYLITLPTDQTHDKTKTQTQHRPPRH